MSRNESSGDWVLPGEMAKREKRCIRKFEARALHTKEPEQVTGFYMRRTFRSNRLELYSQKIGEDGEVDSRGWNLGHQVVATEEEAKTEFDKFVSRYGKDGFIELNDEPSVLGLYDEVNGVVHLMSDALGNRTQGVNSLKDAKALYSDYVIESKQVEELGSDDY